MNCHELHEVVRLVDLVEDYDGHEAALPARDRVALERLEAIATRQVRRAGLACAGRPPPASPGTRCMRCAP